MHAIANGAIENNVNTNAVLVTSEKFTLDFVNSLRKNKTLNLHSNIGLLICFLWMIFNFFVEKNKHKNIFSYIQCPLSKGKQIVMTTDTILKKCRVFKVDCFLVLIQDFPLMFNLLILVESCYLVRKS